MDNLDSSVEYYCSNQFQSQNQVKLGNCLIHKSGFLDILHLSHNLLDYYHMMLLYRNSHCHWMVYSNSLLQNHNQKKLDNCPLHINGHKNIHYRNHNLLHFPYMCYKHKIQILDCFLCCCSQLKFICIYI